MIDIAILSGFTKIKIKDELLQEKSIKIEVHLPKSTQQFFSEREAIVDDYVLLAYSGHLLKRISKSFNFKKVQPRDHESVLFEITPESIEKLSEVLFEITFGYVNDGPDDDEPFIAWAYD